ncbi:hypothetical protein BGX26_000747 [Mortierella sp. AD094]|nr:hypothetical protein BGX26_000747 [Mortierella sp. AD094]
MIDKCPRLSVFVMVGFPFDNDQLIRQIGDRVARASANITSSSDTASDLAGSISTPSTPHPTGLKRLELTNLYFCRVKAKPVEYLLNHCTPDLEELLLSVSFGSRTETEGDDADADMAQIPGTSNANTIALTRTPFYEDDGREWKLRKLTIKGDLNGPGPLIWLPLLRRCSQLQEICVDVFKYGTMEQLAVTLSRCCPRISEITLQCITGGLQEDSRIADLIRASRTVYLDASDMVDSPWACQSLENLKLVITGIARPDLQENQYGDQLFGPLHDGTITGYDLQKMVYGQLGKLTKLQELWLGHDKQDLDDEENYHPTDVQGQWQFIDPDEQFECLEFSLKSGLDLLHGLKDLKVLNIDRMKTKIGLSEVQWMVKRWPKLERIIGLVIQGENTPKHVQWLYDNRPDIELPPVLGHFITAFSAF